MARLWIIIRLLISHGGRRQLGNVEASAGSSWHRGREKEEKILCQQWMNSKWDYSCCMGFWYMLWFFPLPSTNAIKLVMFPSRMGLWSFPWANVEAHSLSSSFQSLYGVSPNFPTRWLLPVEDDSSADRTCDLKATIFIVNCAAHDRIDKTHFGCF